jgi:hypothetical protein
MKWSITSSNDFARCPRIIFYKKQRKGPPYAIKHKHTFTTQTIVGNIVHDAWEELLKNQVGKIIGEKILPNNKNFQLTIEKLLHKYTHSENNINTSSIFNQCLSHLQKGRARLYQDFSKHRIISVEETMDWRFIEIPITGKIDLITKDERGNIWIIDWKTETSIKSSMDDPQLTIYGEWAKINYNVDFIKLAHIYTKQGRKEENRTRSENIDLLMNRIVEDYKYWMEYDNEDEYRTNANLWNCEICKFEHKCPDSKLKSQ